MHKLIVAYRRSLFIFSSLKSTYEKTYLNKTLCQIINFSQSIVYQILKGIEQGHREACKCRKLQS